MQLATHFCILLSVVIAAILPADARAFKAVTISVQRLQSSDHHFHHAIRARKRLERLERLSQGTNHTQSRRGSEGYSPLDEDASENGGLVPADDPLFVNSAGLDIEANDIGYVGIVQIGTPPRDFRLLMDSGSADLWVGAEGCQLNGGGTCGNHTFLGPQSSSSFTNTTRSWFINYGTGTVSGHIVHDDISVAGLRLKNHTFGAAYGESPQFAGDDIPFDGVMGLAKSSLSREGTPTFVEALQQRDLIRNAITSYKLGRVADGKNDGEITFGLMDPTRYDARSLVTVPNVNTGGFWEALVGSVAVDGHDMGMKNRTALLDTGTTLLVAPLKDVQIIHEAIPGSRFNASSSSWTIPCTTTSVVSLSFGGKSFPIDPRDLSFVPVDPSNLKGDCVSSITPSGSGTRWLVGDVFLKNVYYSTDVDHNQISLAKLAS